MFRLYGPVFVKHKRKGNVVLEKKHIHSLTSGNDVRVDTYIKSSVSSKCDLCLTVRRIRVRLNKAQCNCKECKVNALILNNVSTYLPC